MKRIGFVLLTVFMVVGLASCSGGGSGETCTDQGSLCRRTGQSFKLCCTASTCEWQTGGETFNCNGQNCTDAMSQALAWCER